MKKFSVLIALALLAVAGTGYAVTCAYDNVPAASLLVPYWRVSRNGSTGGDIPDGNTNTLLAITNVSTPGVIAHVTVWNKYSKAVLDFNIPLTGKDTVNFNMRQVLNGVLNLNANQKSPDPCGLNLTTNVYAPSVGFGAAQYIRFSHPQSNVSPKAGDAYTSISFYANPAYTGAFRVKVWDSLDESGDVISFTNTGAGNVIDESNPGCGVPNSTGSQNYSGDFSGYVTIDVVNYCTNFFPDQRQFYELDAIATAGWAPTATPNCLMGDVFYIDPAASGGNISGDIMVPLEFDSRLNWTSDSGAVGAGPKTFYGRHVQNQVTCTAEWASGCPATTPPGVPFVFGGDGREPLGDRYGFRYLSDTDNSLQTWILVWREDLYRNTTTFLPNTEQNLCDWLDFDVSRTGAGLYDSDHQVIALTYDNDEGIFTPGGSGGPSGGGGASTSLLYIFLEASRIKLLGNTEINPGYNQATRAFVGGWIDMTLRGPAPSLPTDIFYNQAWVGVQHAGPGTALSVGHSATNLNPQFQCNPNRLATGTVVSGQGTFGAP